MSYDLQQLRDIIGIMRSRFKYATVTCAIIAVISLLIVIFYDDITIRFIGVALFIVGVGAFIGLYRRYNPSVLFRRELRGVNVKEHEFVPLAAQRRTVYRYTGFRRANEPSTHPRGVCAELYLRDEQGEVHPVLGLSKLHTDIYEDGDTLLRPAGCVYPIIVGRSVEKQPCPLCGTINSAGNLRCPTCGIDIINKPQD